MTAPESREPTLQELFDRAVDYRLSGLRVCMPCKVLSYDKDTQTADLLPMIKQQIVNGDGQEETLDFPVIPDVPLVPLRFGPYFIHASTIGVNHMVTCVFSDASLDEYRAKARTTGQSQDPLDLRKHHIADAIALPMGVYGDLSTFPGGLPDHFVIGNFSGSVSLHLKPTELALGSENPLSFVALATLVDAQLTALKATLLTWASTSAPVDPATTQAAVIALQVALQALITGASWPASTASTVVKAD